MISLTQYWQSFNDLIRQYQSQFIPQNQQNINTAKQLITVGMSMETRNLLSLASISSELFELSKQFYPLHRAQLKHEAYLPDVADSETLLFAVLYANHLANYAISEYQGDIYWGRSKVVNGFNAKNPSTAAKARYLRGKIEEYCEKNSLKLSQEDINYDYENPKENYIKSLLNKINHPIIKKPTAYSSTTLNDAQVQYFNCLSEDDGFSKINLQLEQTNQNLVYYAVALEQTKQQALEFNQALDQQQQLLANSLTDYEVFNGQWQRYSAFTKWLLQLIDKIIPVVSLRQLHQAQEQLSQVQSNTLSSKDAGKQQSQYQQQMTQIKQNIQQQELRQQQLQNEKERLEETSSDEEATFEIETAPDEQVTALPITQATLATSTHPRQKPSASKKTSTSNNWFDFFDAHKNKISIGVAAAAVAAKALIG